MTSTGWHLSRTIRMRLGYLRPRMTPPGATQRDSCSDRAIATPLFGSFAGGGAPRKNRCSGQFRFRCSAPCVSWRSTTSYPAPKQSCHERASGMPARFCEMHVSVSPTLMFRPRRRELPARLLSRAPSSTAGCERRASDSSPPTDPCGPWPVPLPRATEVEEDAVPPAGRL